MDCETFELPSAEAVARACAQFGRDRETAIGEEALTNLFATYPGNTNKAHVLLKVVALNDLYSTQIPMRASNRQNVFDKAESIAKLGLDAAFENHSLEIVNLISAAGVADKATIFHFSFATKYASWHRPDVYPMWDQNVQRYLTCLRSLHRRDWDSFSAGFKLSTAWGYPEFHALMVRFRVHYGLEAFSFKDLDKFLWVHGALTPDAV